MITLQHTLISDDLIEKHFVCSLSQCHGACCVAGDSGAPLERQELDTLHEIYPAIRPFLSDEGAAVLDEIGTSVKDFEGDWTTPCVDGNKACAYAVFEGPMAQCGIEKAYLAGVTRFRKPISCHLYPIRVTHYPEFDVLNYDRWEVCAPACALGEASKVPVFKFLKDPLIRKYGESWYQELEQEARQR